MKIKLNAETFNRKHFWKEVLFLQPSLWVETICDRDGSGILRCSDSGNAKGKADSPAIRPKKSQNCNNV
jgi:hypothetical protein